MQFSKCFCTAAQLLVLPSVYAMWIPNGDTLDKMLRGEPGYTVHDVPDEKVKEFLHPLLRGGGEKLVQEVTYRSAASPKRDDIKTTLDEVTEKKLPLAVVNVFLEFVLGPPIEGLDLEVKNEEGDTLLMRAVS